MAVPVSKMIYYYFLLRPKCSLAGRESQEKHGTSECCFSARSRPQERINSNRFWETGQRTWGQAFVLCIVTIVIRGGDGAKTQNRIRRRVLPCDLAVATSEGGKGQVFILAVFGKRTPRSLCVRIPTQIDTHSAGKTTLVPIEIGTCSDANRHPCLG
jgi:hypothetical protein